MELLIFICVGIFTGLSAGLLGIGGGLVSVPAMVLLLPYFNVPDVAVMHMAVATSLALIIPTSLMSAYGHYLQNAIIWSWVYRFIPGLVLGSIIGAYFVTVSDREILQTIFSIFLILIAGHMLWGKQPAINKSPSVNHFFPSSAIGFISSLLGVGGGTMTVPYLMWRGLALPKAIGSSAACGFPIAIAGSLVFLLNPVIQTADVKGGLGMFYWPAFVGILIGALVFAPVGAKLTHRINVVILKRIFIVVLLLVAFELLTTSL